MSKLNITNEFPDYQQEKHDSHLKAGFKLKSTRKNKDDCIIRTYRK